jgi:hypothetical protein
MPQTFQQNENKQNSDRALFTSLRGFLRKTKTPNIAVQK